MAKSVERVKQSGEVFTPRQTIRDMMNRLPSSVWFDPNNRWFEPSAGDGNFLVEIKSRLIQAMGPEYEAHILENMLFSVELIDDNSFALQYRLGYINEKGEPNPILNADHFQVSEISVLTQDLNDSNPYEKIGCARNQVFHHRNHRCWSLLDKEGWLAANGDELLSFGRTSDEPTTLPLLPVRDLGAWPDTDTPDIGERYVVERMLGKQPNLSHEEPTAQQAPPKRLAKQPTKDQSMSTIYTLESLVDDAVAAENKMLDDFVEKFWDPSKSKKFNLMTMFDRCRVAAKEWFGIKNLGDRETKQVKDAIQRLIDRK